MIRVANDYPYNLINIYHTANGYNESCCIHIQYIGDRDGEGYELSFSPDEARKIAKYLNEKADEVDSGERINNNLNKE